MRPLEWTLLATCVVAWIIDVRLRPSGSRRLGLIAAPLVVLAAHVFLEGARWQMAPAYVFMLTRLL